MSYADDQLNEHLQSIDDADVRELAIENKTIEVYERITDGQIIFVGNDSYSMDDFTADFDIDATYFCWFMAGDSDSMRSHAKEKLNELCAKIAEEIIGNMEHEA